MRITIRQSYRCLILLLLALVNHVFALLPLTFGRCYSFVTTFLAVGRDVAGFWIP